MIEINPLNENAIEYKIVLDGVQYILDPDKITDAINELETILGNLNNPDEGVDIVIILDEAILNKHILG
jgi:hypothetical protein